MTVPALAPFHIDILVRLKEVSRLSDELIVLLQTGSENHNRLTTLSHLPRLVSKWLDCFKVPKLTSSGSCVWYHSGQAETIKQCIESLDEQLPGPPLHLNAPKHQHVFWWRVHVCGGAYTLCISQMPAIWLYNGWINKNRLVLATHLNIT